MKKFILVALAALFVCSAVDAQILRADELEKYAKEKYGEKWVDAATNLGTQLTLDKNNAITYTQVIPAEGKTKDQLYVLLNYWFTATFNDANSVIKLNDKELGTIIAQGFVESIAQHPGTYADAKKCGRCSQPEHDATASTQYNYIGHKPWWYNL